MGDGMAFSDTKLGEFTEILSAKQPTPGGGAASALAAALGASLGAMTANYTVGKKKYAAYEEDLQRLLAELARIRENLLALMDEDAAAFEPLSKAYAIPKDEPARDEIMEKCLADAAAAPMEILRKSCRVIEIMTELNEKGSALMQSDVGCGAVFAWSALYGAALNVKVNTRLMKNRELADGLDREVDELMESHWKMADEVYQRIYKKLS